MKYLSIKLTNYIGIYNGMNLQEIFIDFTKCKYNTILIKGDNGSGKSTLFNAISVFPDSNNMFIPKLDASKEISISDNNTIYHIKFVHGCKSNIDRDRETTKAYIHKQVYDNIIDLNPNGNISSYKDIIFEEFGLDSNFIALSQLSTEDRGLADKKPVERKRFVNSIIESIEVYNNIYKSISKQSNSLKSTLNSVSSKINQIGEESSIETQLSNCISNIHLLETDRKSIEERINISNYILTESTMTIERINELKLAIQNDNIKINNIRYKIDNKLANIDIDVLNKDLNDNNILISNKKVELEIISKNLQSLYSDKSSKKMKLEGLNTVNVFALMDIKEQMNEEIIQYINILNKSDINYTELNKDTFILALDTVKNIGETVNSLKRYGTDIIIETINDFIIGNSEIIKPSDINKNIDDLKIEYHSLNNELIDLDYNIKSTDILKDRPSECKIDNCSFIAKAVSIDKEAVIKRFNDVSDRIIQIESIIQDLQKSSERYSDIIEIIKEIRLIDRYTKSTGNILAKLNNKKLLQPIDMVIDFIEGKFEQYIEEIYSKIQYANSLEMYNDLNNKIKDIDSKLSKLESIDLIQELNDDIVKLESSILVLNNNIKDINYIIDSLEIESNRFQTCLNNYNEYIKYKDEYDRLVLIIEFNNNELNEYIKDIDKINNARNIIDTSNSNLNSINNRINIYNKERDDLVYKKNLLSQYNTEYNEILTKYNFIDRIKYHSSPTTGIQLVFMEIYMGNILNISNQLLQIIFEGRFVIKPFIITNNEFRIPCLGNGYLNDDISSLSNGELCMISMIISFSLLYQSSTKYNILKLDEIDAPLDASNRLQFNNVLNKLIEILKCEQCILISHNSELNTDETDMIILKSSSDNFGNSNVIFRY